MQVQRKSFGQAKGPHRPKRRAIEVNRIKIKIMKLFSCMWHGCGTESCVGRLKTGLLGAYDFFVHEFVGRSE